MTAKRPKTIGELFEFYYQDFKPLYNHLQSLNQPPLELFFEVNAAFDHLSRHWYYDNTEEEVVNAAAAHIKRGCFDAFKIVFRDTIDHYNELRHIDTSIIDNGRFDKEMRLLVSHLREGAAKARLAEGDSRDFEAWHKAYELWEPVYVGCIRFDREFYLNMNLEWARRKQTWKPWKMRLEGFLIAVAAGIVVWLISLFWPSSPTNSPTNAPLANNPPVKQPVQTPSGASSATSGSP
jgi:hypothetical protein